MKNPERIDKICDLLKEAWKKIPQQRFGQFLINYIFGRNPYDPRYDSYIFYKKDNIVETSLERLKEYLKEAEE